jgi:hypothetical protein
MARPISPTPMIPMRFTTAASVLRVVDVTGPILTPKQRPQAREFTVVWKRARISRARSAPGPVMPCQALEASFDLFLQVTARRTVFEWCSLISP